METITHQRKRFSQEKREIILNEHFSQGISIAVLARKYGVHAITLYNWKRQMNQKKTESQINLEYVQKLIEENEKLKSENQSLKAKVGELAVKNDILKDGLEIVQKKVLLKELQSPKKSKRILGMR